MAPEPKAVPHVSGHWRIRPFFEESDADKVEMALDAHATEAWKASYRFAEPWPADIKDKIHALYRDDVKGLPGGMGCMLAAYKCLETLHPGQPKYADPGRGSLTERVYDTTTEKTRSVDSMMETLRKDGMAGAPVTVTFDKATNDWKPPAEAEVLQMFDSTQQGVYFFGVSVASGNHTVMLAVDNTPQADGKPSPRIYWLDQHTRGLTNDVTGKLGTELGRFWKDPNMPNRIWALRPEQMTRATP